MMKCQFCGLICVDCDDIQIHQAGSCPAIEEDDFVQPVVANIIVFRWVTDNNVAERIVHIILSDVDNQIELYSNADSNKYESEEVSLTPGNYSGQLVMGNNIYPIKTINITENTTHIDVELSNNYDCHSQAGIMVAVDKPNQLQIDTDRNSATDGVLVNYELNKRAALAKKMAACERDDYEVELKTLSCLLQLNTASFEYFRKDIIEFVNNSSKYRVIRHDPVKDRTGCITAEIIAVGSCPPSSNKLFTINIFQTTSQVMINGAKFQLFVEKDLPSLLQKLGNRRNTIQDANKLFKESIPTAMDLFDNKSDSKQVHVEPKTNVCINSLKEVETATPASKRNRKRKLFEGFETTVTRRRTRKSVSVNPECTEKLHTIVECVDKENNWEEIPKYWDIYGQGVWNEEKIKECNKRKGCLAECGKNNTMGMVQCDGCGRWCHNRCIDEIIDRNEDFICYNCRSLRSNAENVSHVSVVNASAEMCAEVHSSKNELTQNKLKEKEEIKALKEDEQKWAQVHSTDELDNINNLLNEMLVRVENNEKIPKIIPVKTVKNLNLVSKRLNDTSTVEKSNCKLIVKKSRDTSYGEQLTPVMEQLKNTKVIDELQDTSVPVSVLQSVASSASPNCGQKYQENDMVTLYTEKVHVDCGVKNGTLFDNCDNDESVTLGMQFKNKKFLIKLNNILKGKSSQQDILYGMVMKMKEKLAVLENENQQGTVKRSEVLKIQAVAQKLEKSEEKVQELKEKLKKVVSENKDLKKERKDINNEKNAVKTELKEVKTSISLKEKSIIGLHEKLELARVTEDRLNAKIETLESMTLREEVCMNVIDAASVDRAAEKIAKIRELEEEIKSKAEEL